MIVLRAALRYMGEVRHAVSPVVGRERRIASINARLIPEAFFIKSAALGTARTHLALRSFDWHLHNAPLLAHTKELRTQSILRAELHLRV